MKQPKPSATQHVLIGILAIFMCTSCGEASQFKALDKKNVSREVTQMLHDYHDAIREGGLMAEFEYLDNSDDFFWVPPGYESALSYDSVKFILESNAAAVVSASYQWDTLKVFPIAPFIATFTGIMSGTMVSANDPSRTAQPVRMIESGTVIRRLGKWKLLSGQSARLPIPGEGTPTSDVPFLGEDTPVVPADSVRHQAVPDTIPEQRADTVAGDFI